MHEKAVVDRIVDRRYAVLLVGEGEVERTIPIGELPTQATEGTWLRVKFDGEQLIEAEIDAEETEQARQRISAKLDRLRQRGRKLRE